MMGKAGSAAAASHDAEGGEDFLKILHHLGGLRAECRELKTGGYQKQKQYGERLDTAVYIHLCCSGAAAALTSVHNHGVCLVWASRPVAVKGVRE